MSSRLLRTWWVFRQSMDSNPLQNPRPLLIWHCLPLLQARLGPATGALLAGRSFFTVVHQAEVAYREFLGTGRRQLT